MKRILFIVVPVVLLILAFKPVSTFTITGKIVDEKGNPVNGASVVVKGTTNGTATSVDGSFTLKVASAKSTLVISSVGFKTIEIKLEGKTVIDATLSLADNQ